MEENNVATPTLTQQSDLVARALQKTSGKQVYSVSEINDLMANTPENTQTEKPVSTEKETEVSTITPENNDEETQFNALFEKKVGKKYEEVKSVFDRKPFEEEISERLGKPYEEVEKVLKTPQKELRSEYSKKLEEWIENGGIEKDFHDLQSQRWEEMQHEDIIKADLKSKYPNADNQKLDILFKTEYKIPKPLDPDRYSEEEVAERNEEIAAAKIRLELKADEIRGVKISQRVKALEKPITKEPQLTPEQIEENKRIMAIAEENGKKVFDYLSTFKGLSLDVVENIDGKDAVFNLGYNLDKEQLDKVSYILQNPKERILEAFFDKDSKINHEAFVKAVAQLVAGSKATEKMAKDLAHERIEAHIKGLKNANFRGAETPVLKTDQAKRNKELADKVLGKG